MNSNVFSLLKDPPSCIKYKHSNRYGSRTVSVGSKVIIFGNNSNIETIYGTFVVASIYDVDKDG